MGTTPSDPQIEGETELGAPAVESTDPKTRGQGSAGVSRDDLFDVLSNHRRRYALHSLKQRNGTTGVGDLAEEIAAWENGVSIPDLTATQRKRVYTALQQFHLPKMDTTGIVAFDSSRGVVSLTDAADGLDVYLDVVTADDIPWSRYYLGLSALSFAIVIGVWLAPFELLPTMAWAALVTGVFLVSSLVHTYYNRGMRLGSDGTPPDFPEH